MNKEDIDQYIAEYIKDNLKVVFEALPNHSLNSTNSVSVYVSLVLKDVGTISTSRETIHIPNDFDPHQLYG